MKSRITVVTLCLAALVATARAQSLGEIARKTESERGAREAGDQPKTPTKTYSNENLKSDPTTPVTPPAKPSSEERPAAGIAKDASKEAVKDEAYWRARWTPLYKRIAEEMAKSKELKKRIYDLTDELTGIGVLNTRRAGVETERQRLKTESEALDITIAKDQAELEAIREEGRRAGALPGWFR